ncbi:MAG: hypothetical protein H6739_11120 [Alphaproteobacteria bacterium]|nr:hypothetical protein [Alphaproteobacteria bacterium]
MRSRSLWILLLLAACKGDDGSPAPDLRWTSDAAVAGTGRALAALDGGWLAASDQGLFNADGPVAAEGLPEGALVFLDGVGGDAALAWVQGEGLYRSADGGAAWAAVSSPTSAFSALLNPRGLVAPRRTAVGEGALWMAAVGGLFISEDGGGTWAGVDLSDTGDFNLLFTDVAVRDDRVVAVAQLADSVLPADFSGLLSGTVFSSDDGGASWDALGGDLPASALMGAEILPDGRACVAALDGGLFCEEGDGWAAMGGPVDAVALERLSDGSLAVASGTRGLWRCDPDGWTWSEAGPVADLEGGVALGTDGRVHTLEEGTGDAAPAPGGGTVHVALSFHTNLYHSYRGDTNDDDGYGQDIRVIRRILDWLDAHPEARADWDIENAFSLDGWLASDAPDISQRVAARVAAGTDDVRIMSWNNGAMASETRPEFDASVVRAQESYRAAFSETVPGVQPQECMFTPDHIGWYRDHGVDWITLFYSATAFTALRQDVDLPPEAWYDPVTLRDPQTDATMTWVPAYHHGDVLDHGGLSAWASQISASRSDDALLLIHFDADAESWENFDRELDALAEQVASGQVVFTTIQDYLDDHAPTHSVDLLGDVADGNGDGFQSWAGKDFNQRLAAALFASRRDAALAMFLAGDIPEVGALTEQALTPRLLGLSTTHFGLAAPYLADDRVARAWDFADEARALSTAALDAALRETGPGPGELWLVNDRDSAGPALVEVKLDVPKDDWQGVDAFALFDASGTELPVEVGILGLDDDATHLRLRFVAEVDALSVTTLTWSPGAAGSRVEGGLSEDDVPQIEALRTPFTECAGEAAFFESEGAVAPELGPRGVRASAGLPGSLPFCDADGQLTLTRSTWAGLPGAVLRVDATMGAAGDADDAESVALSPLGCPGTVETVRWQTFGGTIRERPSRPGVDSWSGQAVDGWMALGCADGSAVQVAHRVSERSALAQAPLRERDGQGFIAPLGTLWTADPWHDGRVTGGSGLGELVTWLVGSQFRPAAPDWAGATVGYTLLVGEDLDEDVLDLFAHPPRAVVGE